MQPKLSPHRLLIVVALFIGCIIGSPVLADKLPVPDASAQEAASKLVMDVYRDEISKAKKPEEKSALAKKLIDIGNDTKNPAARFALYSTARDMAANSGDAMTGLAAVDAMSGSYEIDPLVSRLVTLTMLSKSVKQSQRKDLVGRTDAVADEAVAVDRYDLAEQAVTLQRQVANQVDDSTLTAQVNRSVVKVQELKVAYAKVKEAQEVLDKKPTDPDANLAVGKYLCLMKGDWEKGLSMLALGSDAELKGLAETEIKGVKDPNAQMNLADKWWDLTEKTEKTKGREKTELKLHAAKWYREVVPQLTGMEKDRVEKRLKELEPAKAVKPQEKLKTIFLSEMPEKEVRVLAASFRKDGTNDHGARVTVNRQPSPHGLSTIPLGDGPSHVAYSLAKQFTVFEGAVALDDAAKGRFHASLTFQVLGDGKELWRSKPIIDAGQSESFRIDISQVDKLELFVQRTNYKWAWAFWVEPRVSGPGNPKADPTKR